MEFIVARKKFFATKRAEEKRNKPPTKAEQRKKMCAYIKHMAGYKDKKFKVERKQRIVKKEQEQYLVKKVSRDRSAMLNDFDRQDVLDLYRLVKERFKTTSPEGYDRFLWLDLITLFEPSEEDEIWKTQQDYTLIS
ncbi:hypothetical protein Tco_0993310 [Tanacetum coccineum]|uniref:Uncharacterized protein n=1 Tax=Tanacetum coccineum TaxID=301880 RepID=A0ABQ5F4K0_9ASTR